MALLTTKCDLQPVSPGLLRFQTIINQERGVLLEYAAKPNSNSHHLNRRNAFLRSLTDSYNQLYQELQPTLKLRMLDTWLQVEHELDLLMADTSLHGVHIRLQLGNGSNYGYINL